MIWGQEETGSAIMKKLGDHSKAEAGCLALITLVVALYFVFAFTGFLPAKISRPIKAFMDDWSTWILGN
jgi:hypothetical protein